MTRLAKELYPYNICANDWNKFQEIVSNLQKFITITLRNYINESYFSMGDVDNHIENHINIFKTGELIDILKECLKRWGGGDYMGKEMIPVRKNFTETDTIFEYTNDNGGMLRVWMSFAGTTKMTLIVDDNVIFRDEEENAGGAYGIPNGLGIEYIIPFFKKVHIIVAGSNAGQVTGRINGIAYINPSTI